MALVVEFSQEDINRGKLITPGWYRCRIDDVEGKLAANGGSTNYNITGTILRNSDNPTDKTYEGFPTPRWSFNSKAPGFQVGFWAVQGVEVESGKRYDLEASKGKEMDVFIENELYESRMVNKINHKYRKASE